MLKVEDQIFSGENFQLLFSTPDSGNYGWTDSFYRVAEKASTKVVLHEQTHPQKWLQKKRTDLELTQLDNATGQYRPIYSELTPQDLKTATELYFAGAPAQAWLIMAAGLAKPSSLGISIKDTKISILSNHARAEKLSSLQGLQGPTS